MVVSNQLAVDEGTIFQYLSETKLLQVLAKAKRPLTFVGDTVTLLRIKATSPRDEYKNSYIDWDVESGQLKCDTGTITIHSIIIISSIYDEGKVRNQFTAYLASQSLKPKRPKILNLFSDVLVNLLSRQSPLQLSEVEFKTPQLSYAIVTTPRSGSTFLCDLLQKSNLAGYPAEHLRRPAEILARHCQFDYIRYMKILMTRRATSNQVFGTKLISHFLMDYRKEGLEFDSFFQTYFKKIIYLQRRDKVAQAISLYLAKATGIWHIFNDETREQYNLKISQIQAEQCQIEKVKSLYDFLVRQEKFIESFIQEHDITPLRIGYEDLVKSKEKYLNDVFDYLEINADGYEHENSTGMKRTKSPLTAQLTEKFRESYPSLY